MPGHVFDQPVGQPLLAQRDQHAAGFRPRRRRDHGDRAVGSCPGVGRRAPRPRPAQCLARGSFLLRLRCGFGRPAVAGGDQLGIVAPFEQQRGRRAEDQPPERRADAEQVDVHARDQVGHRHDETDRRADREAAAEAGGEGLLQHRQHGQPADDVDEGFRHRECQPCHDRRQQAEGDCQRRPQIGADEVEAHRAGGGQDRVDRPGHASVDAAIGAEQQRAGAAYEGAGVGRRIVAGDAQNRDALGILQGEYGRRAAAGPGRAARPSKTPAG